jgi:hypothetical protein
MKNSVIFHSDVKEPEGTGDNDVPLDLGRPYSGWIPTAAPRVLEREKQISQKYQPQKYMKSTPQMFCPFLSRERSARLVGR